SRPLSPRLRALSVAVALAILALAVVACGGEQDGATASGGETATTATVAAEGNGLSGEIAGAGASSQEAAMQAWIATFQGEHPDVTVAYDPIGSGGGREQFIAGGTSFGGTDAAFDAEELPQAQERCGGPDQLILLPSYISPIAIAYNLEGVDELKLSPETLA